MGSRNQDSNGHVRLNPTRLSRSYSGRVNITEFYVTPAVIVYDIIVVVPVLTHNHPL